MLKLLGELAGAAAVVVGVGMLSTAAAWIVAGLMVVAVFEVHA